jgi:ribosomal protein S17E
MYRISIENNSWDYVQGLIEKEINSAFKLREPPTMPTKKEIKHIIKKTVKQRRKDMLKKYEGKLEGEFDHLKEGVDYLDDIQRNKKRKRELDGVLV